MYMAYQPPPVRQAPLLPTDDEWQQWRPVLLPTERCTGKGKHRKCVTRASGTVEQANVTALVRPTRRETLGAMIRYSYKPGAIYLIEIAPHAGTHLLLPPGERLRLKPVLNPALFVVGQDEASEDESNDDVLALRARDYPQRPVNVPLIFRSGLIITLRLVTIDGDPMTTVHFEVPPLAPVVKEIPLSERPPKFNQARAYSGYTMEIGGKEKLTPPWLPDGVADDGSNTLIRFASALDWTRAPVVVGIQQNGKTALTQSRMWHRAEAPEQGAILVIQGLWPALQLQDSAGLTVQLIRQPSAVKDTRHAHR